MKWSQLKKQIEEKFAEPVVGRVEVWNTRYRRAHDQAGEAWITIDIECRISVSDYTYINEVCLEQDRIEGAERTGVFDVATYCEQRRAAETTVKGRGIVTPWDFNASLFAYLNLSIEEAIHSENPIIRAFATLDRRFGKRRLIEFDDTHELPIVQTLYQFRCQAEGVINKQGKAKEAENQSS